MNTTIVTLTDEEARLLIATQRWYPLLLSLEKHNVFGFRNGSVCIYFGDGGEITKLVKEEHLRP